jgi:hypothetical protein
MAGSLTHEELHAVMAVLRAARQLLDDWGDRPLMYQCDEAVQRLEAAIEALDATVGRRPEGRG